MSERLTPEEIERLREADECWDFGATGLRAVQYMLRLHDEQERLRNLQADDVTKKHVAAWLMVDEHIISSWHTYRDAMSAAVRVMSASLDKPADSA